MIKPDIFDQVIDLLSVHKSTVLSNNSLQNAIGEAIARLNRAKVQYPKIMELNNHLLSVNSELAGIRKFMSDEKLLKILQNQSKSDPELAKFLEKTGGKLVRKGITEVSAYDMSALDQESNSQSPDIKNLHLNTEEFYENLWLIIQTLHQVSTFKNYSPKGVRDVRNHLIIHTDKSGASIFSFGFTTTGPILRPIKPTGVKAPNDNGFDPNILEFLHGIIEKLT